MDYTPMEIVKMAMKKREELSKAYEELTRVAGLNVQAESAYRVTWRKAFLDLRNQKAEGGKALSMKDAEMQADETAEVAKLRKNLYACETDLKAANLRVSQLSAEVKILCAVMPAIIEEARLREGMKEFTGWEGEEDAQ